MKDGRIQRKGGGRSTYYLEVLIIEAFVFHKMAILSNILDFRILAFKSRGKHMKKLWQLFWQQALY